MNRDTVFKEIVGAAAASKMRISNADLCKEAFALADAFIKEARHDPDAELARAMVGDVTVGGGQLMPDDFETREGFAKWAAGVDASILDHWRQEVGKMHSQLDRESVEWSTDFAAMKAERDEAAAHILALISRDDRNTCRHDETHRGGYLWEICDQCGEKWADDDGGKPEFQEPREWVKARAFLAKIGGK